MKFFTLTLLSLGLSVGLFAQDTIPNPGFEHWTFFGSYSDPDGWTTLNSLTSAVNVITAYKDSIPSPHSGHFDLKLVTKNAVGNTAPGILTTGQISQANGVTGGQPINSRPQFLSGWYKSAPLSGDTASMELHLFKAGVEIGTGVGYATHTISTWTSFSVPVSYTSANTPDTVQVLFFSSIGGNMQVNSTLWLDDLTYQQIIPQGINEAVPTLPINVFPNPSSGLITLDNTDAQAKTADIYSVEGRLVGHYGLREGLNQLDITNLSKGNYVVSALGSNGNAYRSTLVVE